jgi:hypothetical protein
MGNGKRYVDGFFQWVWRITGLLLLVLVLYGVGSLVVTSRSTRNHPQAPIGEATLGRADRPDQQEAELKLGGFQELLGTSVLYAQLGSEGSSVGSLSSSYTPTNLRNVLFFDTASRQAHWLLDDNTQFMAALSVIGEPDPYRSRRSTEDSHALGLLFLSRPADAEIKGAPTWDIRLASVDGRQVKTLVDGVSTLLDHELTNDHTLLVFYAKRGVAHVLDVDPVTRELRSDQTLPAHN